MIRPPVVTAGTLSPWLSAGLNERYAVFPLSGAMPEAVRAEARILVTTGVAGADRAMIDGLPALGLIAVHGVGYDAVDLDHARARGIAVSNTPDVLTDDVADLGVGLVIDTMRRISANDRLVRAGRWHKGTLVPVGRRVSGARFGILGLGRIGGAIAGRLAGFSDHIAYHNRRPVAGSPYRYVAGVADLARESDVLIVATSGRAGSERLVDAAVLAALGPDGILINVGRGSTVDEAALVAALAEGRIAGAGLDVFAAEPCVPERLRGLDTVVLQPHQASATGEARAAMAALVIENVEAFLAGRGLVTPV